MLLISGLSGAGKSTALHTLEDAGFFCTDNLPLEMLRDWAVNMQARKQPSAVCLDMRGGYTAAAIKAAIEDALPRQARQLLFVEAADEVLQRRFSTLRRPHPFVATGDLFSSIQKERESLLPLRNMADLILDSSQMTPYELAEKVELFCLAQEHDQTKNSPSVNQLSCTLISFSYKHGLPANADIVFDMRFLPNPHYQPGLAALTGRDAAVIDFLQAYDEVHQAERHIRQWLTFIWPLLHKERKRYLSIAMGCSGGRHRSVYMAGQIADWLKQQGWAQPSVQHRELRITA